MAPVDVLSLAAGLLSVEGRELSCKLASVGQGKQLSSFQ